MFEDFEWTEIPIFHDTDEIDEAFEDFVECPVEGSESDSEPLSHLRLYDPENLLSDDLS